MGRHTEVATLIDAIKKRASARGRRYASTCCDPIWLATEIAEYCRSQGWKQSMQRLSSSSSWVILSDDVAALVEGTTTHVSVTVTDLNPVLLKTALVSCGLLALTGAGLVALPLAGVAAWRSTSRSAKVASLVQFIDESVRTVTGRKVSQELGSVEQRLRGLTALKDQGFISREEYESQKARIIAAL